MTSIGSPYNPSLLHGQQIAAQARQSNGAEFRADAANRSGSTNDSNNINNSRVANNLNNQISQVVSKSAPGTTPNIQYEYITDENGELVPVAATVTTSIEETNPNHTVANIEKPILNNGSNNNLVSLSPSEQLDAFGLSDEERQLVNELRARDLEVRVHEAQHFYAAGGLASGGSEFQLQTGPDGNVYAVGGHVNISSGNTTDPEKAARDANTFALAASAPADGSAQDRAVANSASSRAAGLYSKTRELTLEQINGAESASDNNNNISSTYQPNKNISDDNTQDKISSSFTPITV